MGVSLSRILEGKEIQIFDDEKIVRDYIHLEDMTSAFEKGILFRKSGYPVYNIGTGVGTSLKEILDLMEKYLVKSIPRIVVKKDSRIKLPRWNVLDITKAKKDFEWNPKINLENGLKRLVDSIL